MKKYNKGRVCFYHTSPLLFRQNGEVTGGIGFRLL
jgi:hypothetical protein